MFRAALFITAPNECNPNVHPWVNGPTYMVYPYTGMLVSLKKE